MADSKSDDITERLNKLSLKKLHVCELYISLMKNVEAKMDDFRFNLSKTKYVLLI